MAGDNNNYTPPKGDAISLDFLGAYTPPIGSNVALDFSVTDGGLPQLTKYLFPLGVENNAVPEPAVRLQYNYVLPTGFDGSKVSHPNLHNLNQFLSPKGWQSSNVGRPSNVVSYFKDVYPKSFEAALYGRPLVYNLTQYRYLSGFDASRYGIAYLQGGVKYLNPYGVSSNTFGLAVVTNTTANQTIKPSGINSLDISKPNVSPRILYAKGFILLAMGAPDIRSPVLLPKGLIHSKYGNTTVWYHTRPLSPTGIKSFELGYPKAFDPTQFITPAPFNRTAVFGDIAVKNKSVFIKPKGLFDEVVTPWALVENNRRYYAPAGINSQAFGETGIVNKTPSVFPKPIESPPLGIPVIGHRIRAVKPIGFDRLLIGVPALTKTPELLPKGHASSVVAPPTIWYKNRVIDLHQKGIDSFKAGTATAWFRYRYVTPKPWVSSVFAEPVLSHGLRNINVLGFVRDAYGNAWVSRGTRFIEPPSIVRVSASNHVVGGTRYIKPDGYIATKWGTRVIPESQSVAPFGFSGTLGQLQIRLNTRYLKPFGYISVGNQPADRWGSAKLYNKRQYITQVFDNTSGLVPPKWSDWQTIENRNKIIGVTGFASQKFGYSKIDNHAAPLLVKGISPPTGGRFDVSMISHANRPITPPSIEVPSMSAWTVVHNAARVIGAKGIEQTLFGLARADKTRRYYDRVGRIDSFESGTPMISFRIRTIEVEKRYSIAPPIIRLPSVELWTRYATFRGFETAQYGMPSLSIHFNKIKASWAHKDYLGEPSLRNVTPEVGQRGHNSEEFGNASLRTQWRNVYAQGDRATLFGDARIADTKQQVGVIGWQDTRVNQKLVVTKTGTNPYVTQNIFLTNDGGEKSHGIEPPGMPQPSLNQNVLYQQGFDSAKFGLTVLWSNNLQISVGIAIDNIPVGPTVFNKKRGISLDKKNDGIKPTLECGKPRLNPHTIWATKDTPTQAEVNNPGGTFHEVDYFVRQQDGQNKIGRPTLTLQHRTIKHSGRQSSAVGQPFIYLKTRYLAVSPIRPGAMGIPEIPFTPKTINMNKKGFLSEVHGTAVITYPPYVGTQTIAPKGIASTSIGSSRIEPLHRTITAKGRDSLMMGASKSGDTPFMWQGLRVGEHVPLIIGGGDMSLFGKAFISLRIREIPMEGFVAFRSEYTLEEFDKRMKVKGTTTDYVEDINIGVTGIDSMQMGSVGVKWGQQFIRPDGNSDQFRKGGYSG